MGRQVTRYPQNPQRRAVWSAFLPLFWLFSKTAKTAVRCCAKAIVCIGHFNSTSTQSPKNDIDNRIAYQNHFSNRQSGTHILFLFPKTAPLNSFKNKNKPCDELTFKALQKHIGSKNV